MITILDVSKYFYKILNKEILTDEITGSIYRENKPLNSELEDIVINSLFLNHGYKTEIQNGESNINIFVPNINGMPNINRINEISVIVLNLLSINSQNNNNFSYEILETNIYKDIEQLSLSYLNIKLQIHKY